LWAELPAEARGRPVRVIGEAEALAPAVDRANEALAGGAELAKDSAALPAAGAAIACLESRSPAINLLEPAPEKPAGRRAWRRPALLAAAALLIVAGLYLVDLLGAARAEPGIEDPDQRRAAMAALDRQIALGRYVEAAGPPPLALLDDIAGAAPRGLILTHWSYSRRGGVSIQGTSSGDQQLHDFVVALQKSPAIDAVELGSQKAAGGNKVEFDIDLEPVAYFVPPAPEEPEEPKEPEQATENVASKQEKEAQS
jgi:hypothetical protein